MPKRITAQADTPSEQAAITNGTSADWVQTSINASPGDRIRVGATELLFDPAPRAPAPRAEETK